MAPFYRADPEHHAAFGWRGRNRTCNLRIQSPAFCQLNYPPPARARHEATGRHGRRARPCATLRLSMGSLIKKRRKRMRKKKHKKMLKRTRWQRRAGK